MGKKKEESVKRVYRVSDGGSERYYRYLSRLADLEGMNGGTLRNWFQRSPNKVYHKDRKLVSACDVNWEMKIDEGKVSKRDMSNAHRAIAAKVFKNKTSMVKKMDENRSIDYSAFNDTRYEE